MGHHGTIFEKRNFKLSARVHYARYDQRSSAFPKYEPLCLSWVLIWGTSCSSYVALHFTFEII
jgi:hypothetical protein